MSAAVEIEEGSKLRPPFDKSEVLPCIAIDAGSGEVLMLAYMNREAMETTLKTKKATYYSRSRQKLWIKGEQSGNFQHVKEFLVDCDQDCFLLKVKVDGAACHTGYRSCFYRKVKDGSADELEFTIKEKTFDPKKVYEKK